MSYRIVSFQALDICMANVQGKDISAKHPQSGEWNYRLFDSVLEFSLDTIQLKEEAKKALGKASEYFFEKDKETYTDLMINVRFDRAVTLQLDVSDLLAKTLGVKVERKRKKTGEDVEDKYTYGRKELRAYLYKYGFTCDGKRYVRYKRSSGSSREGHCLFIREELYHRMERWGRCGIVLRDTVKRDLASYEAYTALTLSGLENTIRLNPKHLLILEDAKVLLRDRAMVVSGESVDGDVKLKAQECETDIENTIWDGEGLLDESVFDEYGYAGKGMMLLRGRFFKTCAFHTRLQRFFADRGITDVAQLNQSGWTRAEKVEDIKLVVTKSSLKIFKFQAYLGKDGCKTWKEACDVWSDNVGDVFGVVKTEKPTHYFDGRRVMTNYQILNTLHFSKEDTKAFLQESFAYRRAIREDIAVMRHYLKSERRSFLRDVENTQDTAFKFDVVNKLLCWNDDFQHVGMYKQFRKTLLKGLREKMKRGKILVEGTNATLFGNGYELLLASIGQFDATKPLFGSGECYCSFFADGEEILGARSPHITMGNLYVVKNVYKDEINRYFHLTPEIVCVNAIGDNLMQRLNGCDYDSDTMLLTNHPLMVERAKWHVKDFLVPVCAVEATVVGRARTAETLTELDVDIFSNSVGEIVNASQRLNSLLWHQINVGAWKIGDDNVKALYGEICKLAVLSGLEIDKAKRQSGVNAKHVLRTIRYDTVTGFDWGELYETALAEYAAYLQALGEQCADAIDEENAETEIVDEAEIVDETDEDGEEWQDDLESLRAESLGLIWRKPTFFMAQPEWRPKGTKSNKKFRKKPTSKIHFLWTESAMNYVYQLADEQTLRNVAEDKTIDFLSLVQRSALDEGKRGGKTALVQAVLQEMRWAHTEIAFLRTMMKKKSKSERMELMARMERVMEIAIERVAKKTKNEWAMFYCLQYLQEGKKVAGQVEENEVLEQDADDMHMDWWILLILLFKSNEPTFKKLIKKGAADVAVLEECAGDAPWDYSFYGIPYRRVIRQRE